MRYITPAIIIAAGMGILVTVPTQSLAVDQQSIAVGVGDIFHDLLNFFKAGC